MSQQISAHGSEVQFTRENTEDGKGNFGGRVMTVNNGVLQGDESAYFIWVQLIFEAKEMGLTVAEIKAFLNQAQKD